MNTKLQLLTGVLLLAACTRNEPAPSKQEVRSAPIGPAPQGRPAGPGGGPHAMCPFDEAPLTDSTRDAIERALADERAAEARYDGVVEALGSVMPFRQLERAERRHSWALEQLLAQHHARLPAASTTRSGDEPKTLHEACAMGVDTEKKNIALYDDLMSRDLPPDVRCVFSHLRTASRERHLPALERCAAGP